MAQQEDEAHASGHQGVPALAVRSDTAAQTAGTDGDYCCLISDADGRLHTIDGGRTAWAEMEYLALSNTQGTTAIHANTTGSRIAFMGMQGATNATSSVTIQEAGGGTVRVGAVPTVAATPISMWPVTGYPYAISQNDKGLEIVVAASTRIDGVLQFLEVTNTA